MEFTSINNISEDFSRDDHLSLKSLKLFAKYYQEYYGEKFTDLTFAITKENRGLGYVICCILEGKLSLPDGGVIINLFDNNDTNLKDLYSEVIDQVIFLAKQHKCTSIIVKDSLKSGTLSPLGDHLFNQRFTSRITFEMGVDYKNFSVDSFHATLRKSYKSLINWGKKELKIIYLNKDHLDFEIFKKFKNFHHKIAERQTRSDESWQIQYEMIQEGFGELILAWYNDKLVAGSLFTDYGDTSIYFTGVYERELFDYGLSHFLLYNGVCRSYERGNTSNFSLGYFDTDITDSKWYNIQFFKKGFCKNLQPTLFWSKEITE